MPYDRDRKGARARAMRMEFMHLIDPLFSLSGFFVGFLVGLTGVGGGSLMTPLLILLFGIHPATAVGTDLLYAAATKTGGSLPASALTLAMLWQLNLNGEMARSVINLVLCAALLLTAAALLFRKVILHRYRHRLAQLSPAATALATVLVGAALGVVVSISSVGAGAVGVMALLLLYPQLPMARIIGSDIAHAVPLTLVAGAGHWTMGTVDWHLMGSLLVGSLPGIFIGSYSAVRVPAAALRMVLAATLVVVATKIAIDEFSAPSSVATAFTRRAPH